MKVLKQNKKEMSEYERQSLIQQKNQITFK